MLLKNKIALITGSTHNIGLATARAFAREGATVLVHSAGYYLDGQTICEFFYARKIRSRFAAFVAGQIYTMRATSTFDTGNGGQGGRWSEPFIERIFPLRERSQSLDREVRF